MIQVKLSVRCSNIKVNVTCKLQSALLERRVCLIGFRWRVFKRLFNRHDKALVLWEGGAHGAEFVRYGLLGRDAAYCGTDLPTFRWKLQVSSKFIEIYRPLEARSVSCIRYHEYVGGTVQRSGENLSKEQHRT